MADSPFLPDRILNEEALDEVLTRPRPLLVESIRALSSPLVVLGAAGKMGPSLAVLARRAAEAAGHGLEVVAVSRFSDDHQRRWLEERGVRTVRADLLDRTSIERLPDASNVAYLVGLKFGTSLSPSLTWATNTLVPALVAERYPAARIAVLSTGNVYPLVPTNGPGSSEVDPLVPSGEYAAAAIARERIIEFYSHKLGVRTVILRLNYALDLRYGVLVDIGARVRDGEPVDISMGFLNCIWQGDANDIILRSLALASAPPEVLNVTGPTVLRVRDAAERFGEILGVSPRFRGEESPTALLSNSARACALLGPPPTPVDIVLDWTAHWLQVGGRLLGKATHFEVRDGRY
ncbi:MAG TPA: NAD(P)-dependent oxidoreductase [Planctomycetota bacterium]|nr:NAD(P)-dependent oxidoreductase [Planctomycetota bacterium]